MPHFDVAILLYMCSLFDAYKDPDSKFSFAYVDNENIFDFIDEVKIKALTTFEKFDEIEHYLKSQFAGMFYNYLNDIRSQRDNKEVLNSVTELQNLSNRMNEMVDEIGKTILQDTGYEDAVKKQNEKTIDLYTKKIVDLLKFQDEFIFKDDENDEVFETMNIIYDHVLNNPKCYDMKGVDRSFDIWFEGIDDEVFKEANDKLKNVNNNLQVLNSTNLSEVVEIYKDKIKPLFEYNGLESLFKESLESKLFNKLFLLF